MDKYDDSLTACKNAPVSIESVHTPHVQRDETEYIQLANDLADDLDARLVVHSIEILLWVAPELSEDVDFSVRHGFESNPGESAHTIKNRVLDQGFEYTLDTAHVYASTPDYLEVIHELLSEYGDQIPVVHLADGTKLNDGLNFGDGDMDMETVCSLVHECYDGPVVIEVSKDDQKESRKFFERVTGFGDAD